MLAQATLQTLLRYNRGKLYWKVKPAPNVEVGDEAGTFDGEYRSVYIFNKKYKVHRVIFMMAYGICPEVIDHIDGDKLNNNLFNLRPATVMQNRHNSKAPTTNKSGAKGVCYDKNLGKWRVRITVNKIRHDFGKFDNLEEAISVAGKAYELLHKEFNHSSNREVVTNEEA